MRCPAERSLFLLLDKPERQRLPTDKDGETRGYSGRPQNRRYLHRSRNSHLHYLGLDLLKHGFLEFRLPGRPTAHLTIRATNALAGRDATRCFDHLSPLRPTLVYPLRPSPASFLDRTRSLPPPSGLESGRATSPLLLRHTISRSCAYDLQTALNISSLGAVDNFCLYLARGRLPLRSYCVINLDPY